MAFSHYSSLFSLAHLEVLAALLVIFYTLYGIIWRLYFSPIAHIPGPKLAAITWWYEFYYDIILGGQYVFKIIDLHKEYGPIIRINPYEVHVGDPDFFPQLYPASNKRRDRWRFFTKQFGADGSGVGTVDHDLHRIRRAAINPFFSKKSVRNLQPVIEERVDALLARLYEHGKASPDVPLNIFYPFSSFTHDVINQYSFDRCDHLTEQPDFSKATTDYLLTGTHYGKWIQHIELILTAINLLPTALSSLLVPGWSEFLKMKRSILNQITQIKSTQQQDTPKDLLDADQNQTHPTIFHSLLSFPTLPPSEKTTTRLSDEGQVLVQAGTLTSSWALTIATYFLLSQRTTTLRRLRAELRTAIPNPNPSTPTPLPTLEQLPYLRAIVKESFRHSLGTSGRLARICPDETLVCTDPTTKETYIIPAGVPTSMTTYKTVTDPSIYTPDPLAFRPERWLEGSEAHQKRLDRYLTVFGGGGRQCLGQPLAWAELTLTLARMWRVWGAAGGDNDDDEGGGQEEGVLKGTMRLCEGTTERDTRMAADYFILIPWRGSKGVRVYFESN